MCIRDSHRLDFLRIDLLSRRIAVDDRVLEPGGVQAKGVRVLILVDDPHGEYVLDAAVIELPIQGVAVADHIERHR